MKLFSAIFSLILLVPALRADYDIVIYGGTASGVAAALQATRMGKTAIIIEPGKHVGGLTSGGLGWTDTGNKSVIGGIAREFYQRLRKYYENDKNWTFGKRADYKFLRKDEDAIWAFEPKVAELIFRHMLTENGIEIVYGERIDRTPGKGVKMNGLRIAAMNTESGKSFAGKMFIDATYEGDLMAAAGVSYTFGREANDIYGETLNGTATKRQTHGHRFLNQVSPYLRAGDAASGLLPGIEPRPLPADGTADKRLQAYCYRMCMCLNPENRVPFAKPAGYDELWYELLLRNFEAGDLRLPLKIDMLPNGKTDTNNNGAVSSDFIGQNYSYPEASYAEREAILKKHLTYQQGLMWTLQSHPRVPQKIRDEMARWGMAEDEFPDLGNWPHQIYVRESRRMLSDYVQTERDCRRTRETTASVGMGSYGMDSHNCARYVTAEGFVQNEGDVQEPTGGPYRISYLAIVPRKGQCGNLFVPVCVSSTHIAFGSIRMEPVFMILGQSAATAAAMAIDSKVLVQDVDIKKLQARLLADKQVLDAPAGKPAAASVPGFDPKKMEGIVVDDTQAKLTGFEMESHSAPGYVGEGYRTDGNVEKGTQQAVYTPDLPAGGTYEVRMYYTASENRAKNVPVTIKAAQETKEVKVNQREKPKDGYIVLGKFAFDKGSAGSVTVSNTDTDGYVVIDAMQWILK